MCTGKRSGASGYVLRLCMCKLARMTTMQGTGGIVPKWLLEDRLTKSRKHSGMTQAELARALGISVRAASHYENGERVPNRATLIGWAFTTGVSLGWLETGEAPSPDGDGASECARRDSNPKPSDLYVADVLTCEFGRGAVAAVSSPGGLVA